MKVSQKSIGVILACSFLTGCGVGGASGNDSQKALNYIKKACIEGVPELSWQDRTNLVAKAYAIDKSWNKIYESASSLAGIQAITEDQSRWENAPGNDGVQMAYINAKAYSVYLAECNKTGVYK